ncbi:unnamed protein product [Macrosiphum euphorbiae]|uniref:Uncharacterized protein n=1 Tax=Macrosiphum euphorbiae TaxID=13131 RepID=A0AAV0WX23_9HEMI|nr:unnamed protein product [Macrosiphum euphorbiae]
MAVMMFREFYTTVVANEIICHGFLVEKGLLKSAEGNAPCHKCDTEMQVKRRKCHNGNGCPFFGVQKEAVGQQDHHELAADFFISLT